MVFAGVYPVDQGDHAALAAALEKLCLYVQSRHACMHAVIIRWVETNNERERERELLMGGAPSISVMSHGDES